MFVQADFPRVHCREHGVVVAGVPWVPHGAGRHTLAFGDQVAWLAATAARTTVTQLMRVAWRMVGSFIAQVFADSGASCDRFDGLERRVASSRASGHSVAGAVEEDF